MKNKGNVSQAEIIKLVTEQLGKRVNEYLEKRKRFNEELAFDLEQLYTAYGTDLIKKIIERGGVELRKERGSKLQLSTNTKLPVARDIDRPRSKPSSNVNTIAALEPVVTEIVQQELKDIPFTCNDVCDILKKRGILFEYHHVSFIMRRMEGVETVGHRKSDRGGGPQRNVFKVKTLVASPV